jgi:dTDP-4-amino-4,6-dideoxygalactose transaminase
VSNQIPLARPELTEREEQLVLAAMRSGRLSIGPLVERFEREFAAWLGVKDAVAVSSGTAALHLGVRRMGWGAGDIVLTSPLSFVASANCVLYEGAQPVFCDIDPVTLNLDPEAVADAVGHRTAGLLPVHIFGYPADLPALETLAAKRKLPILEDACQALGAVDAEGKRVGTRGNNTTFAFYANKQLTTGEGGMLVPATEEGAEVARSERNQGRSEMDVLAHEKLGFNYRLSELHAALGVGQLERLDAILDRRAVVAAGYAERLAGIEGLQLPCGDRGSERRSWFVYVVQLPDGVDRDAVIDALAKAGIASKPYLPCIHLQPYYRARFGFRGGEFPVAESVADRSLALPFFTKLSNAELDRVCEALSGALATARAAA